MTPYCYDAINRFLRSLTFVTFNSQLEGVTIQCDIEPQLKSLFFIVSLGRLQACSLSTQPILRISGTPSEWLELFSNPLNPQNACSIQGQPEYWQLIREDILHSQEQSKIILNQYPFLRSSFFGVKNFFFNFMPENPFLTKADFSNYQNIIRSLYHKVDQCEWQVEKIK